MPSAQLWHSRPIFITSTFRDMHAERDYLRTVVFPELEERLKERRHRLEPIDLRWGVESVSIDEEHAKELLVLKVCLAEIERSRPFLIALIGDRYGWIPPQERLAAAAAEAGFKGDLREKSITSLEIEFGILDKPGGPRRSRFYFRQSLPYNAMPPEIAAIFSDLHNPGGEASHLRLQALKEHIRQDPRFQGRVRDYQAGWDIRAGKVIGLEMWGRQVLEDLWTDLEEDTRPFLHAPAPSWQEQERWALEEFVQDRSRGFAGRSEITAEILHYALAPDAADEPWGLCLTGESGSGKSALFSHLFQLLQEQDVLLLANAAGINPRSAEVDAVLWRWVEELARFLGEASPLPDKPKPDELQEQFARLLGRAGSRIRVVVLLDALNQLELTPRARQFTWLPKLWPANVRLITTTLPGVEGNILSGRPGVLLKTLTPLQTPEAREIIAYICGRYHRTVSPEVTHVLLEKQEDSGKQACGNPLWLELAIEELNLLDADDFSRAEKEYSGSSEERLHRLLLDTVTQMPGDVTGIYDWMLARNEKIHGASWSRALAVLIALGRSGWRETDLRALLPQFSGEPWDDLRFAVLRRSFRAHLVRRGSLGQYDFFHQQMRQAVARRYPGDTDQQNEWHDQIATFLATLPATDPLRQSEGMYHLIAADNLAAAAFQYAGEEDSALLEGDTRALAGSILQGMHRSPNPGLEWVLRLLDAPGLTPEQKGRLCQRFVLELNAAIASQSNLATQMALLQPVQAVLRGLAAADPADNALQSALAASLNETAFILRDQGDSAAAQAAYQQALAIRQHLAAADPANVMWQHGLAVSLDGLGDVRRLQNDHTAALADYQEALAIAARLAEAHPENPEWQHDLAVSHSKTGDMLRVQGDPGAALQAFLNAHALFEKLAKADPDNFSRHHALAVSSDKLGELYRDRGDLAAALAAYQQALSIREKLTANDPACAEWQHDLSVSYYQMGNVLSAQGDLAAAHSSYQNAIAPAAKLAEADPANSEWQHSLSVIYEKLGDLYTARGELDNALSACQISFTAAEKLAQTDPGNAEWQFGLATSYEKLGYICAAQDYLQDALACYQNSLAIMENLAAADPGSRPWQHALAGAHANVGSILHQLGQPEEALRCLIQSQTIMEKLTASDPDNSLWQRDLSVSLEKLGDAYSAQGNLAAALATYQKLHAIRAELAAADPGDSSLQRDLSLSFGRLGDVALGRGDLPAALAAFQNMLAIAERLAAGDPANSTWQRDLVVSYNRLAYMAKKSYSGEETLYLQKCLAVLRHMRDSTMYIDSSLTGLMEQLENRLGK